MLQRKPLADVQSRGKHSSGQEPCCTPWLHSPFGHPIISTHANTMPLGMATVTLNTCAGRPRLALHLLYASAQRLFLSVFNGLTDTLTWTQACQESSWVLYLSWAISSSLCCSASTALYNPSHKLYSFRLPCIWYYPCLKL